MDGGATLEVGDQSGFARFCQRIADHFDIVCSEFTVLMECAKDQE
jgi:hypothetical protein